MTAPALQYDRLRYIQLRGDGSKLPARKWGGYQQDFDDAEHVHTHDDVATHPAESWGVVDVANPAHGSFALLIFDIDIHKAPDEFDADRVGVPTDTLVTRSQNGGFHVYFALNGYDRGDLQESDFQMATDPGFDIDIRGSVVSHHVVAPADIPGVGGDYEVVNDAEIRPVFEPRAAAERITLDGDPLLAYDPAGGVDAYDFDAPSEPPEDMPTCYHRGLELRKAAPDDHPNSHKVNVLTAACGLAAGYDPETVATHFCGEWAPTDGDTDLTDKQRTEYQVQHIDDGGYSPPAESTLRDYGILDDGEHCEDCPIDWHGSDSPEHVEHTAVLPPAVRDLSSVTSGWDWRHTAEHHGDGLTVDDARDRTTEAIADAYTEHDARVLVEALMTMGKSYGAVKAAARTGEPVTILTGRGRKEQYDQFKQWCAEFGLSYKQLPSFTEQCPTAAGDHGEEWRATVMDWYNRGATPQQIHNQAEYVLGEPLPCQVADTGERIECSHRHAWNFDPDEYDVLLGHYVHAYTQQATESRTVVFDEFPSAFEDDMGNMQQAVTAWLQTIDAVPFESYDDLIGHRDDDHRRDDALLWFDEHGAERDAKHVFEDDAAHADAPLAVYTMLAGDALGNGYEVADLGDEGLAVYDDGRDSQDGQGNVATLRPPDLSYASGVVALDGTPTKRMWELALGDRLSRRQVLDDDERAEYITDALNLNIVRSTDYIKSYNSADHVNTESDAALLEAIADEHGQDPDLITTMTAAKEYDDAGVLNLDRNDGALTGGVSDGPANRVKWYGDILGSNKFDESRLMAVIGSNHYGDRYIKKWAGYAGQAATRQAVDDDDPAKGDNLTYGTFGDKIHRHMREHDTLQSAMRCGRDGNGAVVYVHTDTLPDWVPLAGEARVIRTTDDGERQVLDAIDGRDYWSTADIATADAVDLTERRVRQILDDFADQGVLEKGRHRDDGRAVEWRDAGTDTLPEHVELPDIDDQAPEGDSNESSGNSRSSIYTWISATSPSGPVIKWSERGESPTVLEDGPGKAADPPPNPGD